MLDPSAYERKSDRIGQGIASFAGVSASQIRAARTFFGWTQADLSTRAGVSLATVRRAEKMYIGSWKRSIRCLFQIVKLLEDQGAMFIEPDLDRGFSGGVLFRVVEKPTDDNMGYDSTKEGAVTI